MCFTGPIGDGASRHGPNALITRSVPEFSLPNCGCSTKLYKRGIVRKLVPIPTFLDTSPVENVIALKRLLKTITDIVKD
jgi:hypothetical protein